MQIWLKSAVKILFIWSVFLSSGLAAKLAIVIDDIGYHSREDLAIYTLPKEIAVAIIPSAPYARVRNEQAQQQQRDILIHLPMQPQADIQIEEGGLSLEMTQFEVDRQIELARKVVSNAVGLNNHMGSIATVDESLMTKLMITLRQNRLAFLDSRTTAKSVAAKVAREQGVKVLERHFFLDDSHRYNDILHQFQQALKYARKHGVAVVIGHPRPNTVRVLQEALVHLPKEIELVKISRLWQEGLIPERPSFILLFSAMPATTSMPPFEVRLMLRGVPK